MTQPDLLQRLETLGYDTLPRPHDDSPGFSGLLVNLRQSPEVHQPATIELHLREWDGIVAEVHLHADVNGLQSDAVCPGRIVIRSPQERNVTFFTFGGSLKSGKRPNETIITHHSPAPLLELTPGKETTADLLADETEGLFARAEAKLALPTHELLDRLTRLGPETVYLAVLQSILPKDDETPAPPHLPVHFVTLLENERSWYRKTGRWPVQHRSLIDLLQATD